MYSGLISRDAPFSYLHLISNKNFGVLEISFKDSRNEIAFSHTARLKTETIPQTKPQYVLKLKTFLMKTLQGVRKRTTVRK